MPLLTRAHVRNISEYLTTTGNQTVGSGDWKRVVVNPGHVLSLNPGTDLRGGTIHVHGGIALLNSTANAAGNGSGGGNAAWTGGGGGGGGAGHLSAGLAGAAGGGVTPGGAGAAGALYDSLSTRGFADPPIAGMAGGNGGNGGDGGGTPPDVGSGLGGVQTATSAYDFSNGTYDYETLTIPGGVTALFTGNATIRVRGDLTINGILSGSGRGYGGGAGAPGGSASGTRGASGGGF